MMKNIVFVGMLLLVACQPRVNYRGNGLACDKFDSFKVGVTKMQDVLSSCGTPSIHKDNYDWIYISFIAHDTAFQDVSLKERSVVRLKFDRNQVLKSVDRVALPESDEISLDGEPGKLITEAELDKILAPSN